MLTAWTANQRANVPREADLRRRGTFTRVTRANVPVAPDRDTRGTFTRSRLPRRVPGSRLNRKASSAVVNY
jgi:hypothetical protein